jgi:hypothetical protein
LELVSLVTVAFVVGSTRQRDSGGIVPQHHPGSNTKNNMAAICGEGEGMPVPSFYSLQQHKIANRSKIVQ